MHEVEDVLLSRTRIVHCARTGVATRAIFGLQLAMQVLRDKLNEVIAGILHPCSECWRLNCKKRRNRAQFWAVIMKRDVNEKCHNFFGTV